MKSSRLTRPGSWHAGSPIAIAVSLALSSPLAGAQSGAGAQPEGVATSQEPASKPKPKAPARALRLSDWILGQPPSADAYPLGLSWRVPDEVPEQTGLKLDLISALAGADGSIRADAAARDRLRQWIARLPVTGRVHVPSADGRWLQVNPARDPVLGPGHTVVLPQRPRTVTVVTTSGELCAVLHQPGREARAYAEACRRGGPRVDWAWIAQPDGKVQRFGIAAWNEEKQDEPAPGAWIWAPGRGGGWPERFSERFVRFLATQGPAPDPGSSDAQPGGADAPASRPLPMRGESAEETPPGAGAGSNEGLRLSGGMSLGLSESLLVQENAPGRPEPSQHRADPVLLRTEDRARRSRPLEVSASDWGGVGLLQTPTARMREAGALTVSFSRVEPYTHGNIFLQPFDWMEAGFRYTDVSNRLYGPAELSGTQTYKDKSIDVKFRAWKESAYIPEVAVGLRDIGGTGLFAGEYVVANKRTWNLDWSLGIGWGYLGGRGDLRNPLSVLSSRFDNRTSDVGQGGGFDLDRYFHGPAALFGGVQYQTPLRGLTLKVEYDGNDYQHEPQNNNQRQSSPINVGLVYQVRPGIDLTLGFERGNKVMASIALHTQLNRMTQPKLADPAPVPVAAARPVKEPDWSVTSRDFASQTYWAVRTIERRDNDLRVVVNDSDAGYWRSRLDRAAGVLHRDAPPDVDRFTIVHRTRGVEVAEHVIDRDAWVDQRTRPVPPSEQRETIIARPPEDARGGDVVRAEPRKAFTHGLSLNFSQIVGGPDAFALYQVSALETARWQIRDDTWLQGSARLRLFDNYEKFKYTGPSNLPRVRTFQREYVTSERLTIPNLQLSHVGRVGDNHYYSLYGGLLEEMFGGVGGEWLYRPFASRVALSVDVNAVRQREFDQRFDFFDYNVVTGHASLYWDTGWQDVVAKVSAGRYLAGDLGATVQLSRVFKNGVTIGAFATKTNVSAEEFGEGSFDKGIFLTIPFDAMFIRSTGASTSFLWRPLTRDGGAFLGRSVQLFNLTRLRGDRTLKFEAAPLPNERLLPADRKDGWVLKEEPARPYTRVTPKASSEHWERAGSINELKLTEALYSQQFRNVKIAYDPTQRLLVTAANDDIHPVSRAVGRAARTALLQAPLQARGIEVTLLHGAAPQARYEFFDLERLKAYFDGQIAAEELKPHMKVEWINPAAYQKDPLEKLDDLEPKTGPKLLGALVPETFSVNRVANDYVGAAQTAAKVDWLRAGAAAASLVLTSSLLDNRAYRFARDHASSRWLTNSVKIGDALPWIALGGAGLAAIDGSDPRRSRTGYSALEAGATAFVLSTGLKYAVGRARPNTGLSHDTFEWGTREDRFHSFPSRHSAVAWATVTPFALEYEMPWLYALPIATNLARVGSREHWLSDTVASSLIGYGLGRIFWQSARDRAKGDPKVFFDGSGMSMLWDW